MSALEHVFAVDGGGTKTAAALLTAAGAELARCRVGPANLYRDTKSGLDQISHAWELLRTQADLPSATAARTVISAGLAGASGVEQQTAFVQAFPDFAGRRLSSDGYTAFLGVFGTEPGALLSIGTGVVACHRTLGELPVIRAGWGFPVADRGGGAWLGLRLVAEYLDHLDGAAAIPDTTLWQVVAAAFGTEREIILARLAAARAAEFAALTPAVVAARADPLAATLVEEGLGHILRLAQALAPSPTALLALGGGLADLYRARIEAVLPGLVLPATIQPAPLRGAWLVAVGAVPPEYAGVA